MYGLHRGVLHRQVYRRLAIRWRGLLWALGRRPVGESLPRPILEVLAGGEGRSAPQVAPVLAQRADVAPWVWAGRYDPTLHALEDDGLLVSYDGPPVPARGGRPRRYYYLTPAGRALLA